MLTRKSGILALVMGAMVLGACENKAPIVNVQTPTPATTVSIAGAPTAPLKKGQTAQLVAIVANNTNTAVTWSLAPGSATNVVSVSATGLVTALAQGVATVQAVSVADPTAKAAVSISVDTTGTTGGTVGQPSITISSVTNNGLGTTVNPAAVAGTIDVTLNVDIPTGVNASAVRVTVDGTEVCRQSFATGGSADAAVEGAQVPQVIVCTINTARLNANGTPVFANGTHTLKAEVLGPTGAVIASATYQTLTFANPSVLAVGIAAAKSAQDANGLTWNGGNLTVTVTPQIFNGNTFQSITINVIAKDTTGTFQTISKTVATTGVTAVTAVFDATATIAAGGLLGLEDAALTVSATAVTSVASGGNTFPAAGAFFAGNTIRYDDAAPRLTGVVPAYNTAVQPVSGSVFLVSTSTFPSACTQTAPGVYGCGTAATSAVSAAGIVENGVDVVRMLFQTAAAPATSASTFTTQTTYAGIGAQQPATLQARLQVCDNLDNCKSVAAANYSVAFGVDILPPTSPTATAISGVQTGTKTITVVSTDTGAVASGFNTTTGYILVQVTKDSASATGADIKRCVNVSTGTGTASTALPASGVCAFNLLGGTGAVSGAFSIDPTVSGYGYYTVVYQAVDIAGNVSTTSSRFYLTDATAPAVTGATVTYTTGATTASASATIHDNVDLLQWDARESYAAAITAGVTSLPYSAPTTVKAYGIPVQGNVTPTVTVTLVRGIQAGFGGGVTQLNGVGFSAYDQALNYGEGFATLTTTASAGVTATDVLSSTVAATNATICKTGTATGTCANTSTTVTAQVVMNATATAQPLQTVYFYYIDATGHAQWISSTTAASLVIPSSGVNQDKRVYTWTSSALAASALTSAAAPGAANTVFAVGVDANGNGVLLGTATVNVQP